MKKITFLKNYQKYNAHEMGDRTHDINLSVLIPCYNWDIIDLINGLHKLCIKETRLINFEIICIEDASLNCFKNKTISHLQNVKYKILKKNIGRSSMRNLLAQKANFEWLLFIDCDSKIATNNFITNYVKNIWQKKHETNKILYYGETIYENTQATLTLHQKYGIKIESKRKKQIFSSHHFLVHKSAFKTTQFDVSIKKYGYEDVLFQIDSTNKFCFQYIKNPLYHIGLKKTEDFIKDCEVGLNNLLKYVNDQKIINKIKILRWWKMCSKIGLRLPMILIFNTFKSSILKNLHSNNPSLFLFQFYKLGFFFNIEYNSHENRK